MGQSNGDYEGAKRAFSHALEIARSNGDTVLEMTTLSNSAAVGTYYVQAQDVFDATQTVIDLSSKLDVPLFESISNYFRGACLLFTGDLQNARHHLARIHRWTA